MLITGSAPRTPSDHPHAVFVQMLQIGGDGPRVGIKDSIDVAGYATRAGSAALLNAPTATRHAAVVQSLLDAGCRIVGKTNMHELAYGVTGINQWCGTPLNPRYPGRIPGGSSSGSAVAVAAQCVDFAIGTDTGGSIRVPAACCGIFGLKPTYGRVSRAGVQPATSTLDCVGPFARDLAMLERAMTLIDPTFVTAAPPDAGRLGWVEITAAPAIGTAVRSTLADAGLAVTAARLPSMAAAFTAALDILGAEMWAAYGHLTNSNALGADVCTRLQAARLVTPDAVIEAEAWRIRFRDEVDALLDEVDALVLPTLPVYPPTIAEAADAAAALRLTTLVRQFNFSGHPALTLPAECAGLPVGVQLIGRRGEDAALCALAHRIAA